MHDNIEDIVGKPVPDLDPYLNSRGKDTVEGLTVVKSIPMDSVQDGSYTNYVPKPYGD